MRNKHDHNEYYKYKNTTNGNGNVSSPSGSGWITIIIVGFVLLYFIFSGASWDAIDTLLAFGLLAYLIFK